MTRRNFLPRKLTLPCGSVATRREHEPWFYDVKPAPGAATGWGHIRGIPGVGLDGYRRVWVMPEEVVAMLCGGGEGDENV